VASVAADSGGGAFPLRELQRRRQSNGSGAVGGGSSSGNDGGASSRRSAPLRQSLPSSSPSSCTASSDSNGIDKYPAPTESLRLFGSSTFGSSLSPFTMASATGSGFGGGGHYSFGSLLGGVTSSSSFAGGDLFGDDEPQEEAVLLPQMQLTSTSSRSTSSPYSSSTTSTQRRRRYEFSVGPAALELNRRRRSSATASASASAAPRQPLLPVLPPPPPLPPLLRRTSTLASILSGPALSPVELSSTSTGAAAVSTRGATATGKDGDVPPVRSPRVSLPAFRFSVGTDSASDFYFDQVLSTNTNANNKSRVRASSRGTAAVAMGASSRRSAEERSVVDALVTLDSSESGDGKVEQQYGQRNKENSIDKHNSTATAAKPVPPLPAGVVALAHRHRHLFLDLPVSLKPCKCKETTRCLKLYCSCFRSGAVCDALVCRCKGCANVPEGVTGIGGTGGVDNSNRNGENAPGPRARAVIRCLLQRDDAFGARKKRARKGYCSCKRSR